MPPLTARGPSAFSTYVTPSGDATGATDLAAINAALAANTSVCLHGDFTINGSISMPSSTDLILADAKVFLVAASNVPVLKNSAQNSTGNVNLRVKGVGRAILDGNGTNQVRQNSALYNNCGVLFVNVSGFSIEDVQIGPCNAYAINLQVCSDGRVDRIRFAQDGSTGNQDGIDVLAGCSNIRISNLRGRTGDDLYAVGCNLNSGTNTPNNTYTNGLTGSSRNISDVSLEGADVQIGITPFRVVCGDGGTVQRVRASNIVNRTRSSGAPALQVGPTSYVTTLPAAGDCDTIELAGYQGSAVTVVALDHTVSNVTVSNVNLIDSWTSLVGNFQAVSGYNPEVRNVTLRDVTANSTTGGKVSVFRAAYMVENLTLLNLDLTSCSAILNNSCEITGLAIAGIHVGRLTGDAFQSAGVEHGRVDRVNWDVTSYPTPKTFSAASKLTLGPNMPILNSADTIPAAMRGSRIIADQTVDPTGGAGTTGGEYVGNGSVWTKAVDLGALLPAAFVPSSLATLVAWWDAGQITALADAASVTTWADLSGNSHDLGQSTAGKKPKWYAQGPLGTPVVRFDGVDDTLTTASFAVAQPITVFLVFFLRDYTSGAGQIFFDGQISTGTRSAIYKTTSNFLTLFSGSANVSAAATMTKGLTHVVCAQANGASSKLRLNGTQIATGSPGTGGIAAGVTLGGQYDNTQFAPIDVAECLIYSTALSGADITTAENYLLAKYGRTVA